LSARAYEVRQAVLLVLRAAKAPSSEGVRDGRSLFRAVREQEGNLGQLQRLIRDLTLNPVSLVSADDWISLASKIYQGLSDLLLSAMTVEEFTALDLFAHSQEAEECRHGELPTVCKLINAGRELQYSLGTVASMKGETHVASLVLESYGGNSKRFDLQMALPFIAGIGKGYGKLTVTQRTQMRNLYVAMSRPTDFLCLAANESRVEESTIAALVAKGWDIEIC
jgi:hypothetical protein